MARRERALRVAVAGGSGFIGTHVVAALREAGHEARVISRGATEAMGDHFAWDLAAGPPPPEALAGCDAIVDLVGIKSGSEADFRAAHVDVVRNLCAAAARDGVSRLVHVSVVHVLGSTTAYTRTKREGEAVARDAGLELTILRPALVVGPGDDALSNTIRMVRLAAVFPVPRPNPGWLAVVDVRDVAHTVVEALQQRTAIGREYDVVGPERLTMPQLVERVAGALASPTWCPRIPAAWMRPAAAVLERLGRRAPITRSQLDMLVRGLHGDGEPAIRDLHVRPRALSAERIREVAETATSPSLRIAAGPVAHALLGHARRPEPALHWFVPLALAMMVTLPLVWTDVWSRMTVVEVVLALVAVRVLALPWAKLIRPTGRAFGIGLAAAAVMATSAIAAVLGLQALAPELVGGTRTVLGWTDAWPIAVQVPLLVVVATGEDVVWRAAIGLPLCARMGPLAGSLASGAVFALAHATSGPPILWLAALLAGAAWTALLVRTGSLVAVVTCHVAWDLAMVLALPWVVAAGVV